MAGFSCLAEQEVLRGAPRTLTHSSSALQLSCRHGLGRLGRVETRLLALQCGEVRCEGQLVGSLDEVRDQDHRGQTPPNEFRVHA